MAEQKDTDRPPRGRTPRAADQDLVPRLRRALRDLDQVGARVLRDLQGLAPEVLLDELRVPLLLSVSGQTRDERARDLLRLLRQEAREGLLASAAFQRGRVYCLRCENSICEHATPPGPRHVFHGYGQTGRPEWTVFEQLLAQRKDPRQGLLYEEPRPLLSLAFPRDDLYRDLLPGFEEARGRYHVLAQLCFGYFRPEGTPDGAEPMALTVQVVRGSGAGGAAVVGVNLVGLVPSGNGPAAAPSESLLVGLAEALAPLHRELGPYARGAKKPRVIPGTGIALERLSRRCLALVRDACRDLEHRHRVDARRTRHARVRSTQRDRPTAKAFEDARAAADAQLLQDPRNGTLVVLGPRGRVHVFTVQGRHVTSAVYKGTEIKARRDRRQWVPLPPEFVSGFRASIQQEPEE